MKKLNILSDREFWIVANKMSKAALVDLVHDYVVKSIGESSTAPERIKKLKDDANVVLIHREDAILKTL